MPEKRATYCIDENMLRKTLLAYSVQVNSSACDAIEQETSALRMQKSIALPNRKQLLKYVALPLALLISIILVCVNMESIQSAFTSVQAPVKVTPAKKIIVKHTAINPPVLTAHKTIPPPVENVAVAKRDTIIVSNKTPDSAKKQTTKQAMPVIAEPPTDTATGKTEELSKTSKPDTASQKSEEPPVKKKKKRRRHSNNLDDLKESTLQPNSADDDVVVPQ